MYAFLGCYLAIQPPLKSLPGACDVTSLSPCTDSSHKLRDLQQFMSEQIDLHVFKAITAASCVDIKTHGSESQGQEEAACMRVFWPTRPLQ